MTFAYFVLQRTTRHTSGHEAEELQAILDLYSAKGWRLKQIVMQTAVHQMIIFEREKQNA
jgi:hypothetical protein